VPFPGCDTVLRVDFAVRAEVRDKIGLRAEVRCPILSRRVSGVSCATCNYSHHVDRLLTDSSRQLTVINEGGPRCPPATTDGIAPASFVCACKRRRAGEEGEQQVADARAIARCSSSTRAPQGGSLSFLAHQSSVTQPPAVAQTSQRAAVPPAASLSVIIRQSSVISRGRGGRRRGRPAPRRRNPPRCT
jgi:hypothetical protein